MDVEKTMQFILEMQAKHEVALQNHAEALRQWDERFLRFQEETGQRFAALVDVSLSLARHGEDTDRRFQETDRRFQETDRRFQETDRLFQETNYKLNALIDTVDKLIKHNGAR